MIQPKGKDAGVTFREQASVTARLETAGEATKAASPTDAVAIDEPSPNPTAWWIP